MDKWLIGKITVRLKNNEIIINFSPNHLCHSFSYPASGGSNESKKIFLRHWTCVRCVLVLRTGCVWLTFHLWWRAAQFLLRRMSVHTVRHDCRSPRGNPTERTPTAHIHPRLRLTRRTQQDLGFMWDYKCIIDVYRSLNITEHEHKTASSENPSDTSHRSAVSEPP